MTGTMSIYKYICARTLQTLSHLILTTSLRSTYNNYAHCIDADTEAPM